MHNGFCPGVQIRPYLYIYALEAGVRVINFDTPARSAWNSLISDLYLLISHS